MEHHHGNHHEHEHEDHSKHAGHSVAMFRDKFWLSLLLTLPILAYAPSIQRWLHFSSPKFPGSEYVPLIFGTIIFFYGGLVFIRGAKRELQSRVPGMMTLISLAITTSYIYSIYAVFNPDTEGFFWELATLIVIMLLGHWLEMASVQKAESAVEAISQLLPDKADKIVNGEPQSVLVGSLKSGDLVLVRPGGRVPVDGVVVDGASSVDEAAFTGESKPVSKNKGDKVVAGTINMDGKLIVRVSEIGNKTALAGIMNLVAEAQASKSNAQVLADRAAFALTLIAIAAGVVTFIAWVLLKDTGFALERAVTVLIIACPHALGLAIPLVVAISTALSARNGLLVRNRPAVESAHKLDIVLFDKTGTLTKGEHVVSNIFPAKGIDNNHLLKVAYSLEQNSEHIVGKGIVKKAQAEKITTLKTTHFKAIPGLGVSAKISGKDYKAVSKRYLGEIKISLPEELSSKVEQAAKTGNTEVYVIEGKQVIGAITLADEIRPESKKTVQQLKELGIKSAMVTGDSQDVADHVASQLEVDEVFANVRPEDKSAKVKELQTKGQRVAMVGDGVNDAPALTQADIGVAIGTGTDVAIKSADILLTKSNPLDIVKVVKLSRATYRKMIQNLVWATGYNLLALPLAAGVLYSSGFVLAPAVGAIFMSLSTVIVAINAQMLRQVSIGS